VVVSCRGSYDRGSPVGYARNAIQTSVLLFPSRGPASWRPIPVIYVNNWPWLQKTDNPRRRPGSTIWYATSVLLTPTAWLAVMPWTPGSYSFSRAGCRSNKVRPDRIKATTARARPVRSQNVIAKLTYPVVYCAKFHLAACCYQLISQSRSTETVSWIYNEKQKKLTALSFPLHQTPVGSLPCAGSRSRTQGLWNSSPLGAHRTMPPESPPCLRSGTMAAPPHLYLEPTGLPDQLRPNPRISCAHSALNLGSFWGRLFHGVLSPRLSTCRHS
jgi:hypothetical protein